MKTRVAFAVALTVFGLAVSAHGQMSVIDVYANIPDIVGQTIAVEGFYHSPEYPVLGLNAEMFERRIEPEPNTIIRLAGILPPVPFAYVEIIGVVDIVPRATPLWGIDFVARITISQAEVVQPLDRSRFEKPGPSQLEDLTPLILADDCTFALLLCSDDQDPGMWQDMVNYWNYAAGHLGINTGNIYAFYHDGNSKTPAQIPSANLRPATHDDIRDGFRDLARRIAQCERQGNDATLYKLVTDHGSGYHTGSGGGPPQNWSDGFQGGHVDQDGEEADFVSEGQMKFDYSGPAPGVQYEFDLDNDGVAETFLRNNAGVKELWVIDAAGNLVLAGRDTDGDGDIDAADGGIDLNGDGDKNDSFAWDEDLALSNDTRDILDDEWASWQKMLSDSCLDNLYELIDCCFSGGFKKDEQDSIPCKTEVKKAMASDEGEYSYGALEGLFAGRFMRGLVDSGWTWDEAFQRVAGDPGVTAWESPQWWSKSGLCEGIDVWLEDGTVRPGENVLIPVHIQDVTGWGAMGFETQICWCDIPAGLLQYEYCVPGEVMIGSGWGDPVCNPCDPNCVNIAAAGAAPLTGGGVLFYLKFHVSINAKPCMCCDLRFEYLNLYDPEEILEVCLTDGTICVERCDVDGWVKYWKCCQDECGGSYLARPLDHAYAHLFDCEGPVASQYTDEEGHYRFECLNPMTEECPYCIYVDHCESMDGCITAYDASLILQYLVCLDDLDDCVFTVVGGAIYPQMVAADANCSGHVTAYDASLILQYVVGLIDIFPCRDPWQFFPVAGVCAFECPGEVNWIGIHVADVSGCPDCPPGPAPLMASGGSTRIKLGNASHYGNMMEIPVIVKGAEDIKSVELDITYDTDDFSVDTVEPDGLAEAFLTFWNAADGHMRVAMAGMSGMNGRGRIATIRLRKQHEPIPSTSGRIRLVGALFNEGVPEARIETGDGPVEIHRFALGPVSPNPFVGGTTVNYSVPASGSVTLKIYNVSGQLVTTLVDGPVGAGRQSVMWDGTDSSGRKVSRGVYFCRMKAGGFSDTEKVVLLQ